MVRLHVALLIATIAGASASAADLANGKRAFIACSYCHGAAGEGAGVGPPLKGIVGRAAAATLGFPYSDAMRSSGIVWNESQLTAFLAHPQQVVKGTRMVFPGIAKPKDEADLIAFLKTLK